MTVWLNAVWMELSYPLGERTIRSIRKEIRRTLTIKRRGNLGSGGLRMKQIEPGLSGGSSVNNVNNLLGQARNVDNSRKVYLTVIVQCNNKEIP